MWECGKVKSLILSTACSVFAHFATKIIRMRENTLQNIALFTPLILTPVYLWLFSLRCISEFQNFSFSQNYFLFFSKRKRLSRYIFFKFRIWRFFCIFCFSFFLRSHWFAFNFRLCLSFNFNMNLLGIQLFYFVVLSHSQNASTKQNTKQNCSWICWRSV